MTEQEWLECANPENMLDYLRGKASDRKLRLFTCGCAKRRCRIFEDSAVSDRYYRQIKPEADALCSQLITLVEEHDKGDERWERYARLRSQLWEIAPIGLSWEITATIRGDAAFWVRQFSPLPVTARQQAMMDAQRLLESQEMSLLQARLFRDIFNPFHPIQLDQGWCASSVKNLAESIYNERAFDRLPILADALEDAGCTSQEILEHCRSAGEHVRGCWALDLVLGKE